MMYVVHVNTFSTVKREENARCSPNPTRTLSVMRAKLKCGAVALNASAYSKEQLMESVDC
jgi:hypothetical protein